MKHSPRVMCGLVVLLLTALTEARHSSCRQPSNQELAQYLSGGSSLPESFYQLSELHSKDNIYNSSCNGYRVRLSTFYDEGKNCSDEWNPDPCPVTWMFNYDSDRYPDTLVEAKCKPCERGLFTCRPVYYYTKVMRKGDCNSITGVYNYKQMLEQITVGCAFSGPSPVTANANNGRAHPNRE